MPPQITKQTPNTLTRKTSVLDRIRPVGFDQSDGIKINLYGKPATGKTTLWATFPKPILAMICSGGNNPGELRSIDTPENKKVIMTVTLERSSDLSEIVKSSYAAQYPTIVLDHASGFQDLILAELLGLEQLPAQVTWGLASQQQYGQLAVQFKEHLRALLSLRCNVVIVAQEREFNTESGSEVIAPYVASSLTPSNAGWLNTAVDYICQTFIRPKEVVSTMTVGTGKAAKTVQTRTRTKQVEYCLRTAPDATYITKFRIPREYSTKLPPVLIDPNYDKIMSIIRCEDKPV